jgi:shikimate dehydrogenase
MSDSNQFKLAGIMGMPVFQSRSPILHNYWIKKYNIKGAYGHFPVQVENVETAIRGLSALGIAGCNITQPHKLMAMKMMDQLSPLAQRIGAINCIVVQPDGSLHGFNNDGFGYIQSLKDVNPQWRADTGPITVIGAGGAARAVVVSLIDEGAKEIRLINRTRAKAEELASVDASVVKVYDWAERNAALDGAAMLVNTTNQGMYGQPALEIQLDALPKSAMVSDLIYIPLETPLLAAARARGHTTSNGLGMLLNQAIPAFEAWFGVKPEITEELRQAVLATF